MEKAELVRLVQALQNGEPEAAGQLYDAFQPDIYYFIKKTVQDPTLAEDLTQDTFMEILQTIGKLQEPAAFVTWSRQIAYHRCTAHFRKRTELLADESEDGYSVFDTIEEDRTEFLPDEALDKADLQKTIHEMIDALSEEQRSAIMMRYFDEMSVKEIAAVQGVSEGTVKSRLNYGRKAIAESVETYEKKNGVKLHCVGVVPLLLWLFRQYRIANGISLTATTATAVGAGTAATAAAAVGAGTTATAAAAASTGTAAAATTAATSTAGVGAKVVTTHLAAKIIAGITAAALVTGGSVALLHKPDPEPEPETTPTVEITEAPTEEVIFYEWSGYGKESGGHKTIRFDITVDEMDDAAIRGQLEVSLLYESRHSTAFSGTGTKNEDGTIVYEVTYETPIKLGTIGGPTYSGTSITYDPVLETLTLTEGYHVVMDRKVANPEITILAQDATWSGAGECTFCWPQPEDHTFEIYIEEMTSATVSGTLTVRNDRENTVEHISHFTGRGFVRDGQAFFETDLETTRFMEYIGPDLLMDCFWLVYTFETDSLATGYADYYTYTIHRIS